ncbi:hypothetical protein CLOM_g13805 [Closterium sp. NIES-68]|nr:hypothetical protein CLOM_g13805 [Closterium sp. NIES-68]
MARLPSLVLPWVPSPNERGASADLPTPEIRGDRSRTAASARVGWAVLHAVVVAALLLLNTALTQALVQHRWWFPACYGALFLATLLQYLFTSGSSPGYVQDVAGSIEGRRGSSQGTACLRTGWLMRPHAACARLAATPGAPGQAAAPGAAAAAVNSLAAAAPAALVLPAPPAAAAAAAAAAARQAGQVALEEETEGGAGEEEERCGEGEGDGAMDGAGEQGDESGLLRAVTSHSNGDGASIAALPPPHSSHSSLTVSRWGTPSRASLPHAAPLVPPPPPTSPATAPAAAPASAPPSLARVSKTPATESARLPDLLTPLLASSPPTPPPHPAAPHSARQSSPSCAVVPLPPPRGKGDGGGRGDAGRGEFGVSPLAPPLVPTGAGPHAPSALLAPCLPGCRWCGHVGCTWCGERGCRWCGDRRCCGWCGAGVDMACDDVERGGGDGERECSCCGGRAWGAARVGKTGGEEGERVEGREGGTRVLLLPLSAPPSHLTAAQSDLLISQFSSARRWCPYCAVQQPVRGKHCYDCGRCVLRFDHHCFWLSTCIGLRNHARFWVYLVLECCLTWWSLLICLSAFTAPISPNHWLEHQLSALAFTVLLLPLAVFLAILVAFHTHLILTAQTTYEATRKHRISYLRAIPGDVHPFSHGACRNVLHLCCLSRHVLPLYAVPTPATLHAMVSQTYTTTSHACGPCCS